MCGIAGLLSGKAQETTLRHAVTGMTDAIRYRGPDDHGAWCDPGAGVALGHRRLAVVDLSPAGHQPMRSPAGRFVIVFNGEIYNHADVRRELEAGSFPGHWNGHSDTETLLAGFDAWGVEGTLDRLVGMFAFAVWDCRAHALYLARDRFGEKPLYYGWAEGGDFVFASELKALKAHPHFGNPICRAAVADFMTFLNVPAPRTIYEGIFKLEPGCLLRIEGTAPSRPPSVPLKPGESFGTVSIKRWWSLADVVERAANQQIIDEGDALSALEEQLRATIRLQSLSDVPLGAFLSGGIDSSTVVALMQQTSAPVKTFTVAFEEAGFDESAHAAAVARHLGTQHHELVVTASEARSVIPSLPFIYDEPFADSSQIPTHLVCRAARQHVTVAISGDGGDEMFGGYNRYVWALTVWETAARFPYAVRQAAALLLASAPPAIWGVLLQNAGVSRPSEKIQKLAHAIRHSRSMDDIYLKLVSEWAGHAPTIPSSGRSAASQWLPAGTPYPSTGLEDPRARMMFQDAISYLPNDILCKVDRAAMAVSLETRTPFLDHRVASLAWRLPMDMKIRGRQGKWALRQVLFRHVPKEMFDRPKSGFAIPVGKWLRGPLRSWADALLDESQISRDGYLNPTPIIRAWKEHLAGRRDLSTRLWGALMFQAWLRAQS